MFADLVVGSCQLGGSIRRGNRKFRGLSLQRRLLWAFVSSSMQRGQIDERTATERAHQIAAMTCNELGQSGVAGAQQLLRLVEATQFVRRLPSADKRVQPLIGNLWCVSCREAVTFEGRFPIFRFKGDIP